MSGTITSSVQARRGADQWLPRRPRGLAMNTLQISADSGWLVHAAAATILILHFLMLFWLLKLRLAGLLGKFRQARRHRLP